MRVRKRRIIDKGIRGGTEISCREIRLLLFESGMVHQSHAPSPRFGSFDTLIRATPLAMSLVVRESHGLTREFCAPNRHVHV
jgi:hypothetical protein